jgi:hypothetical protein
MTTAPIGPYQIRTKADQMITMRDGIHLATDLHFPDGLAGPLPIVLLRTPYNKTDSWEREIVRILASHGFVVAIQDRRGRYASEGGGTSIDAEDGYDTVSWLAAQPWSNGKIGTYGCSDLGQRQIELAALRHPNHACAIAQAASSGLVRWGECYYHLGSYENGVFEFGMNLNWVIGSLGGQELTNCSFLAAARHLPVIDIMRAYAGEAADQPFWESRLTRNPADPIWPTLGYVTDEDRFDVPTIHVNSWYDYSAENTVALFQLFQENAVSERARDHQYVIMSPTSHCRSEGAGEHTVVGERDCGDARLDYWRIYLDWFRHWLNGEETGVTQMPRVQTYLMGRGQWQAAEEWPPSGMTATPWHLTSAGRANSRYGDGQLSLEAPALANQDHYVYDPASPVPSRGGALCCTDISAFRAGAYDQREVETRHDILVYTSEPLEDELVLTGPSEVVLYVSSSARDTDFTAKLVEVEPDGTAWNIVDGIARARYRDGLDREVLMEPGQVYEVRVPLQSTSIALRPGHRLRVEISSSNFPRFERNLNTGGNNYDETDWVVAENVIHHGGAHPSRVVLPVVRPADALRRGNA